MIHLNIYPEQFIIITILSQVAKNEIEEYKHDRGQLARYKFTLQSQKFSEKLITNWKNRNRKRRYRYKLTFDVALAVYDSLLELDFDSNSERELLGILHQQLINKNFSAESLNQHQNYAILHSDLID